MVSMLAAITRSRGAGKRRKCGMKCGGAAVVLAGVIRAAFSSRSLAHLIGHQATSGAVLHLFRQRHACQRVQLMCEIDQQLAPLHRLDIVHRMPSLAPMRQVRQWPCLGQNSAQGCRICHAVLQTDDLSRRCMLADQTCDRFGITTVAQTRTRSAPASASPGSSDNPISRTLMSIPAKSVRRRP